MSDGLAALLRRRRMVRDFDPDAPVADEQLEQVLDAALATPSAGHSQVVSLVVLRGEQVGAFWATTSEPDADSAWLRGMRRAPVLVTLWTSEQGYAERYTEADKQRATVEGFAAPWWWVDAGMSALAMLLAVTDTGLDGCFFGVPVSRQQTLAETLGVPDRWCSAGVLAVGRRASGERVAGSGRRRVRRPREERVHLGRWTAS